MLQKISNKNLMNKSFFIQHINNNLIKKQIRLLGLTNEVGAALSPIIRPVGKLISYVSELS